MPRRLYRRGAFSVQNLRSRSLCYPCDRTANKRRRRVIAASQRTGRTILLPRGERTRSPENSPGTALSGFFLPLCVWICFFTDIADFDAGVPLRCQLHNLLRVALSKEQTFTFDVVGKVERH